MNGDVSDSAPNCRIPRPQNSSTKDVNPDGVDSRLLATSISELFPAATRAASRQKHSLPDQLWPPSMMATNESDFCLRQCC